MMANASLDGIAHGERKRQAPLESDRLTKLVPIRPEQFSAFLAAEGKRWLPLIRQLNIKLD